MDKAVDGLARQPEGYAAFLVYPRGERNPASETEAHGYGGDKYARALG